MHTDFGPTTMEQTGDTPRAAPYGHACACCVKAKCKCILRADSNTCERCHRLRKQCAPALQARKRVGNKKGASTSKRAQLENKLEDLVVLLQSQISRPVAQATELPPHGSAGSSTSTMESPQSVQPHFADVWGTAATIDNGNPMRPQISTPSSGPNLVPVTESNPPEHISPRSPLSTAQIDEHAEYDLQTFRNCHVNFYPCVYIPATSTVESLQRERPFLWLSIRAVCSRSRDQQCALGIHIRETLARRVVVEGERTIDLLLGLLVYLGWTHYFINSGKPFMAILSNMARFLILDLPPRSGCPEGDVKMPAPLLRLSPTTVRPPDAIFRTHEERRALLACFVMSSCVSALVKDECLRWNPEMEQAASQISRAPECPGDEILVAIARITRISVDAAKAMRRAGEYAGSVLVHIKPLQVALDQFKASLSPNLLSSKVVLSYLYNADIMVHEIVLAYKSSNPQEEAFRFRRPEYLYRCLEASQSVVENYLSLNIADYPGNSFYLMMHCMHGIRVLHSLSLLEEPGWDRDAVRRLVDVIACLEQVIALMERAHVYVSSQTGEKESVWSRGVQTLRPTLPKWRAGLDNVVSEENQDAIDLDPMFFNFEHDPWLANIFAPN